MKSLNQGYGWNSKGERFLSAVSAGALLLMGLGGFAAAPNSQTPHGAPAHSAAPAHPIPAQHPAPQARPAPARPVYKAAATPRMLENGAPFSFADLVERVSPAVVTVTVEQQMKAQNFNPEDLPEPFRDFFNQFGGGRRGFSMPRKAVAMGSGFVIDRSGLIVTNNHVVEDGKKITVKFPDGREFTAKLLGSDDATDIALLKIKSDKALPSVEFGDDHAVRVGDWVIAVGNPFGLSNTVTAGIISSIGRDVGNGPYTDYLQIDAPINRGNSGGPTFDLQGKVIGMNSMIYSPSGGSVGIGFAIPSSTIHDVVAQLESHGRVARGYLGVQIQNMTPEIASSLGSHDEKGAIVASVMGGGPAAKAGFQPGDVVLALNGKSVEDARDLTRRVAALPSGIKASFTVSRAGNQKTITATIGARKEEKVASLEDGPTKNSSAMASTGEAMGLGLSSVTPEIRRNYNLDDHVNGVLVTRVDPESDAADKGIQPGDVVISIGNKPVRTPQDIKSQINGAQKSGRKSVLVLVDGNTGQRFVALKIA
ncbi:MAG TPA: DegQ family serine endoprotease [Rhizomicrobium sp.]|jgi:serine protease Do|nr:DegQ family serine endoprotease [Rhizomicrobium sp.]